MCWLYKSLGGTRLRTQRTTVSPNTSSSHTLNMGKREYAFSSLTEYPATTGQSPIIRRMSALWSFSGANRVRLLPSIIYTTPL
ncbi:hypothetical protein BDV12DRAFT_180727, partial [Aspergillus spectabilis]